MPPRKKDRQEEEEASRTPNLRSSIYQGTDGYWHGWVTMGVKNNGDVDRRHRTATSEREVTKRVRKLENERDAGKSGKPGRVQTVEEWMTCWLDTILPLAGRAPKTIYDYRSKCRTWIFPNLGHHKLDRCFPEHIEALCTKMADAGKAPSHILKVIAIISSAYGAAIKRGKVSVNPTSMMDPPEIGEPDDNNFTDDEARAILRTARGKRTFARWSFGLSSGSRQGEALGLRWTYLVARCENCGRVGPLKDSWHDPEALPCPRCGSKCVAEARIWHQLQRLAWQHGCEDIRQCTEGKHRRPCPKDCPKAARKAGRRHRCVKADEAGLCPKDCQRHASTCPQRKGGGLVFRTIKEKRKKTIPIATEFVVILRDQYNAQEKERKWAGEAWLDYDVVFAQPDGSPIDPRDDWEEWADLLEEAGVKHKGTHASRHTAATLLLDQGVALAVVQEMLGHSDIRVTRRYTHVASKLTQDAAQRMGRTLFGGGTATKTATKGAGEPAPAGRKPRSKRSRLSESNR